MVSFLSHFYWPFLVLSQVCPRVQTLLKGLLVLRSQSTTPCFVFPSSSCFRVSILLYIDLLLFNISVLPRDSRPWHSVCVVDTCLPLFPEFLLGGPWVYWSYTGIQKYFREDFFTDNCNYIIMTSRVSERGNILQYSSRSRRRIPII